MRTTDLEGSWRVTGLKPTSEGPKKLILMAAKDGDGISNRMDAPWNEGRQAGGHTLSSDFLLSRLPEGTTGSEGGASPLSQSFLGMPSQFSSETSL